MQTDSYQIIVMEVFILIRMSANNRVGISKFSHFYIYRYLHFNNTKLDTKTQCSIKVHHPLILFEYPILNKVYSQVFQNIVLHRLQLSNVKSVTNKIFKSMVLAIVRDD